LFGDGFCGQRMVTGHHDQLRVVHQVTTARGSEVSGGHVATAEASEVSACLDASLVAFGNLQTQMPNTQYSGQDEQGAETAISKTLKEQGRMVQYSLTAPGTAGRGGSISEIRPTKQ
jgi:hypothetical protein